MRLTEDGKIDVDMVEVDKLNKLTKALKDIREIQTAADMNNKNQNGNLEKLIQGLKTNE